MKSYVPLLPTPFFPNKTIRTLVFDDADNSSRAFVELFLRDNNPDIVVTERCTYEKAPFALCTKHEQKTELCYLDTCQKLSFVKMTTIKAPLTMAAAASNDQYKIRTTNWLWSGVF